MTNLFYVNKQIADVISESVDADGVISEEGIERLNSLEQEKEEIVDSLIKSHKNQQVMIDGIDAEMTRLKLRKERYLSTQKSIITVIKPFLTEGEKIETAEYILKWTISSPLVGLENFDAELEYNNTEGDLITYVVKKEYQPTYTFDKALIKKALKTEATARNLPADIYIKNNN